MSVLYLLQIILIILMAIGSIFNGLQLLEGVYPDALGYVYNKRTLIV